MLYTFKNDRTGSYKEVKAASFHDACKSAKSERGWRFLKSEPLATATGAMGIISED